MQIITQVWDYYTDASSNFVPEDRLNDLVIGAWGEFGKGWGKAMHRDYIYYGMTKTNTTNGVMLDKIENIFDKIPYKQKSTQGIP